MQVRPAWAKKRILDGSSACTETLEEDAIEDVKEVDDNVIQLRSPKIKQPKTRITHSIP